MLVVKNIYDNSLGIGNGTLLPGKELCIDKEFITAKEITDISYWKAVNRITVIDADEINAEPPAKDNPVPVPEGKVVQPEIQIPKKVKRKINANS